MCARARADAASTTLCESRHVHVSETRLRAVHLDRRTDGNHQPRQPPSKAIESRLGSSRSRFPRATHTTTAPCSHLLGRASDPPAIITHMDERSRTLHAPCAGLAKCAGRLADRSEPGLARERDAAPPVAPRRRRRTMRASWRRSCPCARARGGPFRRG
jgi:hypothetical protein